MLEGDRTSIARAISWVERREPNARDLLVALYPHTGRAHLVGVTGPPGTGKSTLVNQVARFYRQSDAYREQEVRIGIIAVDPTSPFSGGALLGDRIRMRDVAGDPGVFVRSMATRGASGGLSWAAFDAAQILDAAGYSVILIETVGAGQDEVEIASTAHTTIVVEAPGLGDEIQAIKAGLMEIADIFIVNKADRDGADGTVHALELMLDRGSSFPHRGSDIPHRGSGVPHRGSGIPMPRSGADEPPPERWQVPICKTVALDGTGVADVVFWIDAHHTYLEQSGRLQEKERQRARVGLEGLLRRELLARFLSRTAPGELEGLISRIASRQLAPYEALERLLADE